MSSFTPLTKNYEVTPWVEKVWRGFGTGTLEVQRNAQLSKNADGKIIVVGEEIIFRWIKE